MIINLSAIHLHSLDSGVGTLMADRQQFLQSTSIDYSCPSSADDTNSCEMENSMWDEWTQYYPSNPGPACDEVSNSNGVLLGLPDPTASTSSASSACLYSGSLPAQANTRSSLMATFHPQLGLAPEHQAGLDPASFLHDEAADSLYSETTAGSEYFYHRLVTSSCTHPPTTADHQAPSPLFSGIYDDHGAKLASTAGDAAAGAAASAPVLGPQSPSSPLALQNGMLNPLGDPWDQHQHHHGWFSTWTTTGSGHRRNNIYNASPLAEEEADPGRPRHTDIYIGPNGTIESTPGGWTPQFYDGMAKPATSSLNTMMRTMVSATAGDIQSESSSSAQLHRLGNRSSAVQSSFLTDHGLPGPDQKYVRADDHVWFEKDRLELSVDGDDHHSALQLKRSKYSVGHHASAGPSKLGEHPVQEMLRTSRYYNCPASGRLQASQATHLIAIGPALNTNGKPRARRGSATDPQSVYARQRRERINDRLKSLQHLVPNGAKVDIVTMLDEAYDYIKFLQYQVTLLKSDEFWMHATPYNYNGMDISNLPASGQTQELESSAATLDLIDDS